MINHGFRRLALAHSLLPDPLARSAPDQHDSGLDRVTEDRTRQPPLAEMIEVYPVPAKDPS
jgi:hypothetical protein